MQALDVIKLIISIVTLLVALGLGRYINQKYEHFKSNRQAFQLMQIDVNKNMMAKLQGIEHEVKPDGGHSLNDKITDLVNGVSKLDTKIELITSEQRLNREIMGIANWESDEKGKVTYVSIALCEIIGCTQSDLIDSSWVGYIDKKDRQRVISEWTEAVSTASEFNSEFNYILPNNMYQPVKAVAIHIKKPDGTVLKTLGRITKTGDSFKQL